ncbi:MAG: class I SAM-dependent methyltransferase [Haliea sp.]|nr:class I SAM-dependent methyltransferase [Haliea sp.]
MCSEEVPEGGKIALIGAPRWPLYCLFLKNSWDIHLIDRNPSWKNVSSGVTTHTADIYESEPPADLLGSVHLVVADPPWYLESYAHFLWFSARLLIPEGKLALSLLPKGTRPSAPTDRKKIYDKAAQMGLNFQSEHSRSLSYASPPF